MIVLAVAGILTVLGATWHWLTKRWDRALDHDMPLLEPRHDVQAYATRRVADYRKPISVPEERRNINERVTARRNTGDTDATA